MTRFLARRLLNYIVLLAMASFLIFALASVSFEPLDSLLQRNPRPRPRGMIFPSGAELGSIVLSISAAAVIGRSILRADVIGSLQSPNLIRLMRLIREHAAATTTIARTG